MVPIYLLVNASNYRHSNLLKPARSARQNRTCICRHLLMRWTQRCESSIKNTTTPTTHQRSLQSTNKKGEPLKVSRHAFFFHWKYLLNITIRTEMSWDFWTSTVMERRWIVFFFSFFNKTTHRCWDLRNAAFFTLSLIVHFFFEPYGSHKQKYSSYLI